MSANKMKTIGVIGGLGPMASVYLTELITRMVEADRDQEHPRVLTYSIPDTPDRTAFLLGKSDENPLPCLQEAAQILEKAGADFLAIPCVTAQFFHEKIQESVSIPVLSLIADVAEEVESLGVRSVGIMATDGTIKSGLLEKDFTNRGIRVVLPEAEGQKEVMSLIYDMVKTGRIDEYEGAKEAIRRMETQSDILLARGAERVILGCTELSLIRREMYHLERFLKNNEWKENNIDILEVLARHAVKMSGAKIRS